MSVEMHVKGRKKGCLFKTISQALITLKQEIGKMNDSFRNYLNQWNRIYKEGKNHVVTLLLLTAAAETTTARYMIFTCYIKPQR